MIYKNKKLCIKNKFFIIFLSLYIIGLIFSVTFSNDIALLSDKVKAGMEELLKGNAIYSVTKLSASFFSVSLMLWSFCVFVNAFRITSFLGIAVALYTGYSAGLSSVVILNAYPQGPAGYMLMCIVPAAVMRFLIWYAFLCLLRTQHTKKLMGRRTDGTVKTIGMLFVILISDVLISILSVSAANIFF